MGGGGDSEATGKGQKRSPRPWFLHGGYQPYPCAPARSCAPRRPLCEPFRGKQGASWRKIRDVRTVTKGSQGLSGSHEPAASEQKGARAFPKGKGQRISRCRTITRRLAAGPAVKHDKHLVGVFYTAVPPLRGEGRGAGRRENTAVRLRGRPQRFPSTVFQPPPIPAQQVCWDHLIFAASL